MPILWQRPASSFWSSRTSDGLHSSGTSSGTPFPEQQSIAIIEKGLGKPVTELFASFEATPMASAETPEAALAFSTLQAHEAAGLESIAGRILPEDESGPGAIKGGVIYFIDKVLGSSRQEWLGLLREGLLELDAQAMSAHGSASFALLESAKQDELLRAIEQTTFFDTMRMLTMAGMFALPEYGGNRDHAGWQLIGFGHHQVWQPPFGHYDADYIARGE